jgi:hypothetical protein
MGQKKFRIGNIVHNSHFRRSVRKGTRLSFARDEDERQKLARRSAARIQITKAKNESAHAAAGDQALVQDVNPAGSGAFAKTWDHGMEKTGEAGQQKRASEGNGLALMLEIGLPDGLGMGEKKPRKHGQDPVGHRE